MRKRRYGHSRPKKLNPILQGIVLILWVVLSFAPLVLFFLLGDRVALSDPEVIASWERASCLWSIPLIIYWSCSLLTLFLPLIDTNTKHQYYERPCYGIAAAKRRRKIHALLWSIGFVVLVLLSLLSLSGRECLTKDGKLQRYDMFNQLVDEYTADDVIGIQLKTVKNSGRHQRGYTYSIKLCTENDEFYFKVGSFFLDEHSTLQALLAIRERYEPNVTIISAPEHLKRIVNDRDLNEDETALLYELFNQIP